MENTEEPRKNSSEKSVSELSKPSDLPTNETHVAQIAKFFTEIGLGTEEERAKFRFGAFHSAQVEEEESISFRVLGNSETREESPYA